MRLLHRLRQNLAARDVVVRPVVGDFLLGPDARQDIGEFLPHAARVVQICPIRRQLVRIAGPAEADIDAPMAQDVESGHASCHVQWVMNRRQHHPNAEADTAGALTDRGKSEVRGAVV